MKIEETILLDLYDQDLFNKDFNTICLYLTKNNSLSLSDVKKGLEKLISSKDIVMSNKTIVKSSENQDIIGKKLEYLREQKSVENLLLGRIENQNGVFVFVPSNKEIESIVLPYSEEIKQNVGKRVCANVDNPHSNNPKCTIEKVFGVIDDPISENIAIAYKHGFKSEFSPEVMEEVEQIPQYVTKEEMANRVNMQDKFFMPWDPATCKDKDDAIYAEKTEDGYKVYVAIADVSHYVKMGTALDKEAFKRGTSCYLGSGVYPMLPTELSNGICSLNDNQPRLALVSVIDIDKKGKIVSYDFKKAVINIKQSFCYEDAEKVHLCEDGFDKKYSEAKPYVDLMYEITDILEKKLNDRGCLKFDNVEPQYVFSKDREKIEEILISNQERSHMVVEQFMILANEATAKFFKDKDIDTIYRTHSAVSKTKISEVNQLLHNYGINFVVKSDNFSYKKLLELIKTHPAKEYLNSEILKSMSKASYRAEFGTHFGLASSGYIHFTSPIRRYPDTLAHRLISQYLENEETVIKKRHIEPMANHLNSREKMATKAEKESDRHLACLWAEQHSNQIMTGHIVGVSSAMITVRHNAVSVNIPTYNLYNGENSNYSLAKNLLYIKDKNSGKKYALGDKVKFAISQVDYNTRSIYATAIEEKIMEKSEQA